MITLITINYNNADGLSRTLASVALQDYGGDFEHVVIDGASTDGSACVAKAYAEENSRVRFVCEKDTGIYNAMNKGLSLATNEYVAFLNSGDVFASDQCLRNLIFFLDARNGVDMLYGDVNFQLPSGKINRVWTSGSFSKLKLYLGWMPPHPMTIIKRSLIEELKGFNEEFRIAADYDLMLRILFLPSVNVKYIHETIVNMEDGGVSNGSLSNVLRSNYEVMKSWIQLTGILAPYWIFFFKPILKLTQLRK